jgi:hypothetical protein
MINRIAWLVCWRDLESIVYSIFEFLPASDVPFRGLHGRVTEKELNLFKFTSCTMEESGTGTASMLHAACPSLCRIPDHAESLDLSCAGTPFGSLAMRHNPNTKTNHATLEACEQSQISKPFERLRAFDADSTISFSGLRGPDNAECARPCDQGSPNIPGPRGFDSA